MCPAPLILAADVGGTNCRLGLFSDGELVDHMSQRSEGPGLIEVILPFLAGRSLLAACVAVAGPTARGKASLTNHPWSFDEAELSAQLGVPVRLVNDFEGAARGVPELSADGLITLQEGQPDPEMPIAVLGSGTGLGQALLVPSDGRWRVLASQGGHVDFGPTDDEELALRRWLLEQVDPKTQALRPRVSYEDVLSGGGLVSLNNFYVSRGLAGPLVAHARDVVDAPSAAAQAAVQRFCRILGAQSGNVALSQLARGGVVICGGIPPRLPLQDSALLDAFAAKGKMAHMMGDFRLQAVTDPHLGLRGAAALASERLAVGRSSAG